MRQRPAGICFNFQELSCDGTVGRLVGSHNLNYIARLAVGGDVRRSRMRMPMMKVGDVRMRVGNRLVAVLV